MIGDNLANPRSTCTQKLSGKGGIMSRSMHILLSVSVSVSLALALCVMCSPAHARYDETRGASVSDATLLATSAIFSDDIPPVTRVRHSTRPDESYRNHNRPNPPSHPNNWNEHNRPQFNHNWNNGNWHNRNHNNWNNSWHNNWNNGNNRPRPPRYDHGQYHPDQRHNNGQYRPQGRW